MAKHLSFEAVKGYATYANAQKRGEEVAAKFSDLDYRWVVIALPSGRYTPMVICNDKINPGWFIGMANICIAN